jgi:hypothetical protein
MTKLADKFIEFSNDIISDIKLEIEQHIANIEEYTDVEYVRERLNTLQMYIDFNKSIKSGNNNYSRQIAIEMVEMMLEMDQ